MEFQTRYRKELSRPEQNRAIEDLARLAQAQTVTLLYGASDKEHNQAVVLKECIDSAKNRVQLANPQVLQRATAAIANITQANSRSPTFLIIRTMG